MVLLIDFLLSKWRDLLFHRCLAFLHFEVTIEHRQKCIRSWFCGGLSGKCSHHVEIVQQPLIRDTQLSVFYMLYDSLKNLNQFWLFHDFVECLIQFFAQTNPQESKLFLLRSVKIG